MTRYDMHDMHVHRYDTYESHMNHMSYVFICELYGISWKPPEVGSGLSFATSSLIYIS